MPLSVKQERLAYQREWSRKKRAKMRAKREKKRVLELTESYEESIKAVKDWKRCVKEARKIVSTTRKDRMKVAAWAIRACEIRHGGDQRTYIGKAVNDYSVKRFAEEIGLNNKTLFTHIYYKERIWDKMTEQERLDGFNLSLAKYAVWNKHRDRSMEPIEAYRKILSRGKVGINSARYVGELRRAANYFTENLPIYNLTAKEMNSARQHVKRLLRVLEYED